MRLRRSASVDRRRGGYVVAQETDHDVILVESSLARMQLRRILDMQIHNLFLSEAEALAWLCAGDIG